MRRYQLILFDLDDTLFDFNACWDNGMKEALRVHPATHDLDTDSLFMKMKHYGDVLWPLIEEKQADFNEYRRLRFMKAMAEFGRETTDEIADEFQQLFMAKNAESITINPQLVAMMTILCKTYQLGIITNGPADQCYKKIDRLGLTPFFPEENVFVSEEVGHYKPEPEIYQKSLEHFGVDAAHTLFVGDSWLHDVAGPIALGMSAIWLNWKDKQPGTDHQPIAVMKSMDELMDILETAHVTL